MCDGSSSPPKKSRTGDSAVAHHQGRGEGDREYCSGDISPHGIIRPGEKGLALHHTSKNSLLYIPY